MYQAVISHLQKIPLGLTTVKSSLFPPDVSYVVESANWAIQEVGKNLTAAIPEVSSLSASCTVSPRFNRSPIVHYGSLPTMFNTTGFRTAPHARHSIATVFHLANDRQRQRAHLANKHITVFHTASFLTSNQLESCGIPAQKIITIPLGINLSNITPITPDQKAIVRRQFKLPPNKIIIGSFQKDGVGWQEGNEPKKEKGPDLFAQTVRLLAPKFPLHILLIGPARGYLKQKLSDYNIPFTHLGYLSNHYQVLQAYQALDYYLISSRVEGGPLALLEAWASGIPVITTPVGMVPDIATHGQTASISKNFEPASIADAASSLLSNKHLQIHLSQSGQEAVKQFNWKNIVDQYVKQLYQPLL